ncbi:hypothetical protein L1987_13663 [Smallanthus sonchifolius]|uniref:Uncharacterized protein n=1 Tax=Smallanthus sonchifolius TaxID=185202 RepID=A0ACB9JJE0_9ASTR|nr:hypothetical protein L1987_13663 [Smallanthus sonchifolius]
MENYSRKPNWLRRNCIGKGSFGVVSLAVESDNGLTFAVKSVDEKSGEFLRCLENEIQILKSLSSPYVVRYLGDDVTCEFSSVYRNLHMEYMSGGTAAEVAKHTNAGVNIRSYTRCITSALSYIHARNVVHCDVKGANVLIGNTPGMAKLADFGSAIELGVPFPGLRGSPQWMAPEVIRGEYIGPKSDVWSLGCTVIEMLTGKPAWQDMGADTFRQIGYSDDLPEIPSPVPDDLRDFLEKCLKREPSERWSCDQLLHHPFLLSCTSPSQPQIMINDCKLSPRCVFDWSDASSSDESMVEIYQFNKNKCSAKQRIGKLASNKRVNWETEGWEMVRHVTITTNSEFSTPGKASSEYSDSIDGEANVSGSGRANSEDTESNASYNYDFESTTSDARGTMVSGIYKNIVDVYRCKMFVWIQKLFPTLFVLNSNVIQHIHHRQWLKRKCMLIGLIDELNGLDLVRESI